MSLLRWLYIKSLKQERKKEEKKEKFSPSYFGNKPKEGKIISEYMKRPEE